MIRGSARDPGHAAHRSGSRRDRSVTLVCHVRYARAMLHSERPPKSHMNPQQVNPQQAWSDYWGSGALHSCIGSYADNYSGQIESFWSALFAGLADGAQVLDIGCGNGSILQLAARHAARASMQLHLHGIDQARVQSEAITARCTTADAQAASVSIQSGVPFSAGVFAPASFQLISSQFALEYFLDAAAIARIAQILAPGGRLGAIVHNTGSVICRVAREELAQIERMLAVGGVFDTALALAPYIARAQRADERDALRGDARAHAVRLAFNDAVNALLQSAQSGQQTVLPNQVCGQIFELFTSTHGDAAAIDSGVRQVRANVDSSAGRLRDLLGSALDEAGLQSLREALHAVGLRMCADAPILHDDGRLIATGIVAEKSAGNQAA